MGLGSAGVARKICVVLLSNRRRGPRLGCERGYIVGGESRGSCRELAVLTSRARSGLSFATITGTLQEGRRLIRG